MSYTVVAREITLLPQLSACRGAAAAVGRSRRPRRRRPRKTKAVGTLVDAAREGWNPTAPPLVAGPGGGGVPTRRVAAENEFVSIRSPARVWVGDLRPSAPAV